MTASRGIISSSLSLGPAHPSARTSVPSESQLLRGLAPWRFGGLARKCLLRLAFPVCGAVGGLAAWPPERVRGCARNAIYRSGIARPKPPGSRENALWPLCPWWLAFFRPFRPPGTSARRNPLGGRGRFARKGSRGPGLFLRRSREKPP